MCGGGTLETRRRSDASASVFFVASNTSAVCRCRSASRLRRIFDCRKINHTLLTRKNANYGNSNSSCATSDAGVLLGVLRQGGKLANEFNLHNR